MDDQLVWKVCEAILPADKKCEKCPHQIQTAYGPAIQGCRLHAEDLIELIQPTHSASGEPRE